MCQSNVVDCRHKNLNSFMYSTYECIGGLGSVRPPTIAKKGSKKLEQEEKKMGLA